MSDALKASAAAAFAGRFGRAPDGVCFAPGRVNLIGEHVDYNGGLVLPMPVREGTAVAWSRAAGDDIVAVAADFREEDRFDAAAPAPPEQTGWRSYVRGMAANMAISVGGAEMLVMGDLPRGSGLSSSASLCIAVGRALAGAADAEIPAVELAKAAQRTEHGWAGVACGIMDQMAIAAGVPGHAMLLDCRDLSFDLIRLPSDWSVVVAESGVVRGLVDGAYNLRRQQCEAAARALGVPSLREARAEQLAAADVPDVVRRRGQHVITEIARVRAAVAAMRSGDIAGFGKILAQGHASLRDLFEVSVPAVDQLVEALQAVIGNSGGARMTGAGFGGSVVAVLPQSMTGALSAQARVPVRSVI